MKYIQIFFVLGIAVLIVLCGTAQQAIAQWSNLSTVNTPVCSATDSQTNSATVFVYPTSGHRVGTYIAWQDRRDGLHWHIYAQWLDMNGVAQWHPEANGLQVSGGMGGDQINPRIAADSGGNGVDITWQDNQTGRWQIHARYVDSWAQMSWDIRICPTDSDQINPQIASKSPAGVIITWQDHRNGNWDIYAQSFNYISNPIGSPIGWGVDGAPICTADSDQTNPQIACLDSAIITWQDHRNGNWDIYAQKVDPLTGNIGREANGVAICTADGDQINPRIAETGIITWEDNRSGADWDIYAGVIPGGGGSSGWGSDGNPISAANGDQVRPTIASDDDGGAIIAWRDSRDALSDLGTDQYNFDIYAQRIDANGAIHSGWDADGVAICTAQGMQLSPVAVREPGDGTIITWADHRTGAWDIYAQHLSGNGTVLWTPTDGVAISTASLDQQYPSESPVITCAPLGAIIAWTDTRNGNPDIYAQWVLESGVLPGCLTVNYGTGWNICSLPVIPPDRSVLGNFPSIVSRAFAYQGSQYAPADTLEEGVGYWLKFRSAQSISTSGIMQTMDTISVSRGWNLIGPISVPISVYSITSTSPGMTTSQFFGYNAKYFTTDSIQPGKGYWVKVNRRDSLILSAGPSTLAKASAASRIRVVPTDELPPAPPDEETSAQNALPKEYALEQNYPNPFNPTTTLKYQLPVDSRVKLNIYNLLGQVVQTLLDGMESAGYKSVEWKANSLASGIYFYRLEATSVSNPAKGFTQVKKMLLLK